MSTRPISSFLSNLFSSKPKENSNKNNRDSIKKTLPEETTLTPPKTFFRQCDDPYVNLPTNNTQSYSVITKESEFFSKNEKISKFETKTFFRQCDPDASPKVSSNTKKVNILLPPPEQKNVPNFENDSDYQNIEQVQIEEPNYSEYNITAKQPKTLLADEATELLRSLNEKDPPLDSLSFAAYVKGRDRYKNILPFCKTIVKVDIENAIVGYHGAYFTDPLFGYKYILMQAPLPESLGITKTMMKQHTVKTIVCLINTKEEESAKGERSKCHPYWEKWGSKEIEGFTIRTPNSDEEEDWGKLKMLHFKNWPDRGVPKDVNEFMQFVELQRKDRDEKSTTAVHCSAGIGRTGVYMVATLMMDQIEKGATTLNPVELVALLRKTRPGMVQTSEQLMFCFEIANVLLSKKQ